MNNLLSQHLWYSSKMNNLLSQHLWHSSRTHNTGPESANFYQCTNVWLKESETVNQAQNSLTKADQEKKEILGLNDDLGHQWIVSYHDRTIV